MENKEEIIKQSKQQQQEYKQNHNDNSIQQQQQYEQKQQRQQQQQKQQMHKQQSQQEEVSKWNCIKKNLKYILAIISFILILLLTAINIYNLFKMWSTNDIRGVFNIHSLRYGEDITDIDWQNIHHHLYYLIFFPLVFLLITQKIIKPQYSNDIRMRNRVLSIFYIIIGLCMSFLFFRIKSIYTLAFNLLNYTLTHTLINFRYFVPLIWIVNLAFINLSFIFEGFDVDYMGDEAIIRCISFSIDYYNKQHMIVIIKEENNINHEENCNECRIDMKCYKLRINSSHDIIHYNFLNFLAYLYYPPLYYRGPIITFNDFIYQHLNQQIYSTSNNTNNDNNCNNNNNLYIPIFNSTNKINNINECNNNYHEYHNNNNNVISNNIIDNDIDNNQQTIQYINNTHPLIQENHRFIQQFQKCYKQEIMFIIKICLLYGFVVGYTIMYFPTALLTHLQNEYLWIRKIQPLTTIVSLVSFVVWKWLIQVFYWKVCLYWSISNNIHPIDNVGKLIFNFQSVRDIFRNYERSYYEWVVKYVYIPLGGKYSKFINIILIVQLYLILHEIDLHILYWGLAISALFILEEIILVKFTQINSVVRAIISTIEICFVLFITILAYVPRDQYFEHIKSILKENKSKMSMWSLIIVIVAILFIQLYHRLDYGELFNRLQKEKDKKVSLNQSMNSNLIELTPQTHKLNLEK